MQVLNTPVDPLIAEFLYEVVCPECAADIRFSRAEALTEVENVTAHVLTIECPVCARVVHKTLNKKVQEQLVVVEKYHRLPF